MLKLLFGLSLIQAANQAAIQAAIQAALLLRHILRRLIDSGIYSDDDSGSLALRSNLLGCNLPEPYLHVPQETARWSAGCVLEYLL